MKKLSEPINNSYFSNSYFLLINKEKGWTTNDVVRKVKGILEHKVKIGHTGTLDPIAEGLVILAINEATKYSQFITSGRKKYIATAKLGIDTDTNDITGEITETSTTKLVTSITEEILKNTIKNYQGKLVQIPPKYSALKHNGKRLYKLARNNEHVPIEIKKREIEVYKASLVNDSYNNPSFSFSIDCSKGTYVRSLIRDIGYDLKTYATMTGLLRTDVGSFKLADAITINEFSSLISNINEFSSLISNKNKTKTNYQISISEGLNSITKLVLETNQSIKLIQGQLVKYSKSELSDKYIRAHDLNGTFIGVCEVLDSSILKPYRMMTFPFTKDDIAITPISPCLD